MPDSSLPVFAESIFLYDGNTESDGIGDYDSEEYRRHYSNIEFIEPGRLLDPLAKELVTKHRDFLDIVDNTKFVIPNYQRYYSWEENQHQELWEEVLKSIHLDPSNPEKPPENFFGTIYIGELSDRGTYEVIDGQQRLTTFTLLLFQIRNNLKSILNDLSGDAKDFAEHVQEGWLDEILLRRSGPVKLPFLEPNDHDDRFFQILFNENPKEKLEDIMEIDTYDGRRSNAVQRRDVVNAYSIPNSVIEDAGVEDDELDDDYVYFAESHQLLIQASDFYNKKIGDLLDAEDDDGDSLFPDSSNKAYALINLSFYLLRSFRLAEIQFQGDNRELRVNVFQELNDKGKELSTMDKIKARIVSLFQDSSTYEVSNKLDIWENILENFNGNSGEVEDFLVYYIAATRNPEDLTTARNNLLDIFRLNVVGEPKFSPMLDGETKGSEFLDELNRFSNRYVEILDCDLSGGSNPLEDEHRCICEEMVRRMDDLGTSQWIPFVLFLYDDVSSTAGKSKFFKHVMKTIENITFRVSLTELNATVLDTTYISAANSFRDRIGEAEEDPEINLYDEDEIRELLLERVPNRRQLTGDTFIQNLVMEYDWKANKSKQLLLKIIDEGFEEEDSGIVRRELDDGVDIELEHILPQQFVRGWDSDSTPSEANPYAWVDDFFYGDTSDIDTSSTVIDGYIDDLKDQDAAECSESNTEYDHLNRIIQQISSLFVRDIGNMMVLVGGLNSSIQNKRFSVKIKNIHERHPEDLDNRGNKYFSKDGSVPSDKIDTLLETNLIDDDTDEGSKIEQSFNNWWNLSMFIDRKSNLLKIILNSLEYNIGSDKFDIDSSELQDRIRSDLENRCNQPI